jgi:deoxycytidylate deaminase
MDAYVRKAAHTAERSNHKHHWHGCLVVNQDDGSIVSTGYNHTPPKPLKNVHSVHAEMHALSKFKQAKYPNCFMVIVRVGPNGGIKSSKPCPTCQKLIESVPSIRRVYYTDLNVSKM